MREREIRREGRKRARREGRGREKNGEGRGEKKREEGKGRREWKEMGKGGKHGLMQKQRQKKVKNEIK